MATCYFVSCLVHAPRDPVIKLGKAQEGTRGRRSTIYLYTTIRWHTPDIFYTWFVDKSSELVFHGKFDKMGIIKTVASSILVITFLVFVAFFGRLPALRWVWHGHLTIYLLINRTETHRSGSYTESCGYIYQQVSRRLINMSRMDDSVLGQDVLPMLCGMTDIRRWW